MLQWLTSEDEYVSCLLKVPITISPFLLLHRGVQKWSIAEYCPHLSFITLEIPINLKRQLMGQGSLQHEIPDLMEAPDEQPEEEIQKSK